MTKRKDHLILLDDVAKSVLLGVSVKALCGRERSLTREDMDVTDYFGTCKDCMSKAGADASSRKDVIRIHPKDGWLSIIERAWLARYEDSIRPRVTWSTPTANATYTYTIKSWGSPKAGDR